MGRFDVENVVLFNTNDTGLSLGDRFDFFMLADERIQRDINWTGFWESSLFDDYFDTSIEGILLGSGEYFVRGPANDESKQDTYVELDYMIELGYGERVVEVFRRNSYAYVGKDGSLEVASSLSELYTLWKWALEYRNYVTGQGDKMISRMSYVHGDGAESDRLTDWIGYTEYVYESLSALYGDEKLNEILDNLDEHMLKNLYYDSHKFN